MHEAMLYHKREKQSDTVICDLCRHRCHILPGRRGLCGVRKNTGGILESLVFGYPVAQHPDPIEKKPFFHFLPGTRSMSLGTVGCNFKCEFCQNCDISQYMTAHDTPPATQFVAPEAIVDAAEQADCKSISYTYNEPTVFLEYALETAQIARERGLGNCFVSNGFMTPEAIEKIAPLLDAINVDLKCYNDKTYRKIIGGTLEGVLDSLRLLKARRIWIEITTLLIPGVNDSAEEIRQIAEFIADLDPAIPWHVSRFHPQFKMLDRPPTAGASIFRALEAGKRAGLHYVYCGNLRDANGESTHCHQCGETLIERAGFLLKKKTLGPESQCPKCQTPVAGIWHLGQKRPDSEQQA